LFVIWTPGGNSFRTKLLAFATSLLPVFPDQDPVGRPLAGWLILIDSAATRMPLVTAPVQVPYEQLVAVADYMYRICWLAAKPSPTSPNISTAQQTAILAAYNLNF
jgi:transglutaminase-like putative cysteine protease